MNNTSVTWRDFPAPPANKFGWPWSYVETWIPEQKHDNFKYPKITVVTPSYNQEQFIEETIRSVLLQNYPNLEYIIIDGGSSDKSVEIIHKYEKYLTYWVSEKDRGQSHAINKGFAKSSGDILCWINSDDLLKAGALELVARIIPNTSIPNWVIGFSEVIDSVGKPIKLVTPNNITLEHALLWTENWFAQQSTFWTRPMWNAVNELDESLHYAMDFALWLDMFEVVTPLLTPEILSSYRYQENAKCLAQPSKAIEEVKTILWQYLKQKPRSPKIKFFSLKAIGKIIFTQKIYNLKNTKLYNRIKKIYKTFKT